MSTPRNRSPRGLRPAPAAAHRRRTRLRPNTERLESRALLATLVVNTALDVADPNDGLLSLREAILLSDGTLDPATLSAADQSQVLGPLTYPAPNVVSFAIPGGGVQTISVASPLPAITAPLIINGYSQAGAYGNDPKEDAVDLASLTVRIDGHALALASPALVADGLSIVSPNCTVSGLNITGFTGAAVSISGAGSQGNWLYGNNFGTLPRTATGRDFAVDPTLSNGIGVKITSSNNRVGGNNPGLRNVIGNNGIGVVLDTPTGTGNLIQNNFIIDSAGPGVKISSSNNTIGEAIVNGGNTISGNGAQGVLITGGPDVQGNLLVGNQIGTDLGIAGNVEPRGLSAKPNKLQGVLIQDSPKNTVGGYSAVARNVIGGNNGDGLAILGPDASNNRVLGNWIGFNIVNNLESLFIANQNGIVVTSAGNVIGDGNEGGGNTLDNNRAHGIVLSGAGASGNTIQGNIVGLNPDGGSAFGNALDGVHLDDAPNNVIGGTTPGARNVISSNNNGVALIGAGATGNIILGNFIGTASDGLTDLGNAVDGILISGGALNTVGGTDAGAGNVISGNNRGIHVSGATALNNLIQGNFVGTDLTGQRVINNEVDGVRIDGGASFNTIGGTLTGAGNTIAFNAGNGVTLDGGTGNTLRRNGIHDNHGLGIALNAANHANDDQPAPVITSSSPNLMATNVQGSLDAAPNTAYTVEFFRSPAKDPTGFGQGAVYIDSTVVTTDATGHAVYNVNLITPVASGQFITATATDPSGNTSAFSNAVPAVAVQLQLGAATATANETDPSVVITVTRTGGMLGQVAVDYATGGGTAVPGVDYQSVQGTVYFNPGDPSTKTFTVPLLNPNRVGGSVNFNVTLSNPANGSTLGTPSVEVVTVNGNVPATIALGAATYTASENAGTVAITVTRNSGVGTATVDYATANGTAVAGVNYTATSGTVTFPAGSTTQTVTVPLKSDNAVTGPLTFTLTLSNPTGAGLGGVTTATVTETNADTAGTLRAASTVLPTTPGATVAKLVVIRSGGAAGTATVRYSTGGGTAKPGVDYTTTSGVLTFGPGVTSQTVSVPLLNTSVPGTDSTFEITLSNASGATLGTPTVTTVSVRHPSSPQGGGGPSPTVVDLLPVAGAGGVTGLVVTFSAAMNAASASAVGNFGYFATSAGPDGLYGTYDDTSTPIASAGYNATTHQSLLTFAAPLRFGPFYRVVFNATPGSGPGLIDTLGDKLDGTGTGQFPGSAYVATFAEAPRLTYTDRVGDAVSLALSGPGLLAVRRGPDGNAQAVRVLGGAPGLTALSGSVRRPNRWTTTPVVIPVIQGAAGVKVKLKAPFVVGGVSATAVDHLTAGGRLTAGNRLVAWSRKG